MVVNKVNHYIRFCTKPRKDILLILLFKFFRTQFTTCKTVPFYQANTVSRPQLANISQSICRIWRRSLVQQQKLSSWLINGQKLPCRTIIYTYWTKLWGSWVYRSFSYNTVQFVAYSLHKWIYNLHIQWCFFFFKKIRAF